MFGYNQQMQMAAAMAKSFSDATNSAVQASSDFWTGPKAPEPGKSWYKPPAAPNPFDWNTWMKPVSATPAPWAAWGTSFNPMALGANTPWSAIASFASAMAAMQPAQQYWAQFIPMAKPAGTAAFPWASMMWPMQQFNAMAAAMTAPTDFASYRSAGGHAMAQISYAAPTSVNKSSSRLH